MATLTILNVTSTTCSWIVGSLSNEFSTDYYIQAGLATGQANSDATPPTGILDANAADPPGGGFYSTNGMITGLTAGTSYTLYGFAQALNTYYYPAGSASFTTLPARPSDFAWTNSKSSGGTFNLTATEWNAFTAKVNGFRTYKGLSSSSFTSVSSGDTFTATIFNQSVTALGGLSSYFTGGKTITSSKSQGDTINAAYLNDFVSALNSIA